MVRFCQFQTSYAGKCLMYISSDAEFCDRHLGKKEPIKKSPIKRFRGNSKWQKENGGFKTKNLT